MTRRLTKKKLHNLEAGKAVSSNIEEFILSIKTSAENLWKRFTKEFVYQRFERLIEKQKLYTFATESEKKKIVILFN